VPLTAKEETMSRILTAIFLFALALGSSACAAASMFPVGGASSGSSVATTKGLWNDVPRMDGFTTSQMDLPIYAKLLVRTMLSQNFGDAKATEDWALFSTKKTPEDVKNFYTNARMTAGGWKPIQDSACFSGADQGIAQVGVLCAFQKDAGSKQTGLLIIASPNDQNKETDVFFARVDGNLPAQSN
jgi:hypothetical protein